MIFKGCATAMVTPFSNCGKKIDFDSLANQIEFQIQNDIDALVILGTTGEPSTLSFAEKRRIVEFAVKKVNSRVPVIVGAGSNDTKIAIKQSKSYEKLGADALLSVTPYYNKCTQQGLISHFSAIAKSVNIPIILYNVPGRTGVNMLPSTVLQLAKIPNIAGIKEASGNLAQIMDIIRECPSDFDVYSGDDELLLPTLAVGAKGVISVISNIFPDKFCRLCNSFFNGDRETARRIQFELNPLIKMMFCETNPIPVKAAMNIMGLKGGALRLPLTKLGVKNKRKLEKMLINYKS